MKYEFKSTGNKEVDKVIKEFDKQIKKEYKSANGKKENCISFWGKRIFLKTLNLDINDWRKIRSGNYYITIASLEGIEKSKFIYNRVIDYLR